MTVALDESVECAIGLQQPEDPANWKEDDKNLHGGWGYPSFIWSGLKRWPLHSSTVWTSSTSIRSEICQKDPKGCDKICGKKIT